MNRLTITLDDDLYAMARAHAVATGTSLSKAISDLLRRRQVPSPDPPSQSEESGPRLHPLTGFPILEFEEGLTMKDIQRSLDDEDVRHLEMMGLSPEEIEHALNS